MYCVNHGSKTGVKKGTLCPLFSSCCRPRVAFLLREPEIVNIYLDWLETSCLCQCHGRTGPTQCNFIDSYNLMSRKRSKNVISCQFPKFLETRICGHRAVGSVP